MEKNIQCNSGSQRLNKKSLHTFIQLVEFYPSVSEELLKKALDFGRKFTNISTQELQIIMHSKRSLLFQNDVAWVKKGDSGEFDVTMGSFDGAKTCELVGLYILGISGNKFGKEIFGLYRDDELACLKNLNVHQSDKLRKDITKVFKEMGLGLTIQSNLTMVNFLDVTFNLKDGTYKPYKKRNDIPTYININSNHPSNNKQIPTIISKRMSEISSDEEIFKNAAPHENALKASGYQQKLSYQSEILNEGSRRNRSRKIICFNPPFSINVKSNIAREFLHLINKHFPKKHRLHKLFNSNNV